MALRTTPTTDDGSTPTHPVDEVLSPPKLFGTGLQHVAAMYAGVVAPPLIVGAGVGLTPGELALLISASLFTAGLATLLQTLGVWRIGARLPFVNGVSFAGVAPMLAIAKEHGPKDALPVIFGAVIVAGVLCFLAAPYFCRLVRFFPAVVQGTVITLIGVSLLPVAVNWARGGSPGAPGYGSAKAVGLAAFTLAAVVLGNRLLRGFWQQMSLLIGLAVGTAAAFPLGLADFSKVGEAQVFALPSPFHFGGPQFDIAAIVSMCIVMVVSMTESTADMLALGRIVDREADEPTLAAGLRADGLATAVSPVFNGFACSAFAQNIGLVALTKVRSRFVVAAGGGILVLLGLFPVLGSVVSLVPQPVLGGAGIVLFGTVAASGIRTLAEAGMESTSHTILVSVSLGVGIIPIAVPSFYDGFPEAVRTLMHSGISAGCLAAVLLNLLFHHVGSAGRSLQGVPPWQSSPPPPTGGS
ncbi:nucleobase:cation symporter-2 family protein [Kitasatospora sp. YST-16]|uniref:nucleobase:cation symporter-2 family protein n=1 Tax=unclassified Kitasatospora TaxID=2633591 RepID=UPI0004C3BDD0|nr:MULTISPECIES: nucleobase:cation symporter-2 family protein [unclassified Kitasatospora]WAL75219.1 nucleobase:cation symporter-2 family protein [Kitasatospora sp. YST-16]WNW41276.1 nucleobase:cation symporter-2 family protein [Streptomyces sp. Li-HN-5-13]